MRGAGSSVRVPDNRGALKGLVLRFAQSKQRGRRNGRRKGGGEDVIIFLKGMRHGSEIEQIDTV